MATIEDESTIILHLQTVVRQMKHHYNSRFKYICYGPQWNRPDLQKKYYRLRRLIQGLMATSLWNTTGLMDLKWRGKAKQELRNWKINLTAKFSNRKKCHYMKTCSGQWRRMIDLLKLMYGTDQAMRISKSQLQHFSPPLTHLVYLSWLKSLWWDETFTACMCINHNCKAEPLYIYPYGIFPFSESENHFFVRSGPSRPWKSVRYPSINW